MGKQIAAMTMHRTLASPTVEEAHHSEPNVEDGSQDDCELRLVREDGAPVEEDGGGRKEEAYGGVLEQVGVGVHPAWLAPSGRVIPEDRLVCDRTWLDVLGGRVESFEPLVLERSSGFVVVLGRAGRLFGVELAAKFLDVVRAQAGVGESVESSERHDLRRVRRWRLIGQMLVCVPRARIFGCDGIANGAVQPDGLVDLRVAVGERAFAFVVGRCGTRVPSGVVRAAPAILCYDAHAAREAASASSGVADCAVQEAADRCRSPRRVACVRGAGAHSHGRHHRQEHVIVVEDATIVDLSTFPAVSTWASWQGQQRRTSRSCLLSSAGRNRRMRALTSLTVSRCPTQRSTMSSHPSVNRTDKANELLVPAIGHARSDSSFATWPGRAHARSSHCAGSASCSSPSPAAGNGMAMNGWQAGFAVAWLATGASALSLTDRRFKREGLIDLGQLGLPVDGGPVVALGDANGDQLWVATRPRAPQD